MCDDADSSGKDMESSTQSFSPNLHTATDQGLLQCSPQPIPFSQQPCPQMDHKDSFPNNGPTCTDVESCSCSFVDESQVALPHANSLQGYNLSNQPFLTPSATCTDAATQYTPTLSPLTTLPSAATTAMASSQSSLSPSMLQYVKYLKSLYFNRKVPMYDKEHTQIKFKAKTFINLALVHKEISEPDIDCIIDGVDYNMIMNRLHGKVDAIVEKKTRLQLGNVCRRKDGSIARSVLVEGAPGVGKTTFAFELCKQWARGEILQEWQAVIILKLRDRRMRTATSLDQILCYPSDPEIHKAVVRELSSQNGEGLLLILDGYDELTEGQRDIHSVFQWLMRRELLCSATLVVTSRPLDTSTLDVNFVQSIDQHIEVLGFTKENIEEYIKSVCGDKPELEEDFKKYLSSHPFSSSLMYNPLQCAIVTDLYRCHWERGDKGFAPRTITELYTGLVHTLLLRHLTHHPVHERKRWRITEFTDLPSDVKEQFDVVANLAAEGIKNQQYVFDEENDSVPSETLGLMVREEEVTAGIGVSTSYTFLHLTLQEYLAAVCLSHEFHSEHLTELLSHDLFSLEDFIKDYGQPHSDVVTHWPVILFLAGRTSFRGVNPTLLSRELNTLYSDPSDIYFLNAEIVEEPVTVFRESLLHILYETQHLELIQSTLTTRYKYLILGHCSSALDLFVAGYCIANSNSKWRVIIQSFEDVNHLILGIKFANIRSKEAKIGSLFIDFLSNMELPEILVQLQPYATTLTELVLNCQVVNYRREISVQHDILSLYPNLSAIKIIGVDHLYPFPFVFDIEQNNLHTLIIKKWVLCEDVTDSIYRFLQSEHCRLHRLTLEQCTVSNFSYLDRFPSTYNLSMLKPNEFALRICNSHFIISNIMKLQPLFICSQTLTELSFSVTESSTSFKFDLSQYPMLKTLEIDGHPLRCNSSLLQLPTYRYLPDINLLQLSPCVLQFKSQSNNLQTLSLVNCIFQFDLLIHFLQSRYCKLCKLVLHECTMTTCSDSLNQCLSPKGNDTLQSLSITDSDCVTIKYLLSRVHPFTKLEKMFLCSKEEDADILSKLPCQQFICSHQNNVNLRTLSLVEQRLSHEFASALVISLQSPNVQLCELMLNDCYVFSPQKILLTARLIELKLLPNGKVSGHIAGPCSTLFQFQFLPFVELSELKIHLEDFEYWVKELCSEYLMHSFALDILRKDFLKDEMLMGQFMHYLRELKTLELSCSIGPWNRSKFTFLPLSIFQFVCSQQNKLLTLTLCKCKLSMDAMQLLILSLQSPHCRLQNLTLNDCTMSTEKLSPLLNFSLKNSTLQYLHINNSWRLFYEMVSKVYLCTKLTELVLNGISKEVNLTTNVLSFCPVLETLKIYEYKFYISHCFNGSPYDNLHTLSLVKCTLSIEATNSLVQSLQSANCRLCNLTLEHSPINFSETDTLLESTTKSSNTPLTKMLSLCDTKNSSLKCLVIIGSIKNIDQTMKEFLQWILTSCLTLETLVIHFEQDFSCSSFPLSCLIPRFIKSQESNLQSLVISQCKLSSEFISSFVYALQSPHCKLVKLALYKCELPAPEHIHLVTAIANSNTIQCLLFICHYIDNPLLFAFSKYLKHNKTIKELAVSNTNEGSKKYSHDFLMTEAQFRILLEGVDGSAVKRLWINKYCSGWLCDGLLSRNVNIEYYDDDHDKKFTNFWLYYNIIANR